MDKEIEAICKSACARGVPCFSRKLLISPYFFAAEKANGKMVARGRRTDSKSLSNFFLFETFKEDVGTPVVSTGCYANTVRRRLIDLAGKIVSHSERIVLKIAAATFDHLSLADLFERCKKAPAVT